MNWVAIQKAMQDWVCATTGLPDTSVVWMQQDGRRPPGAAVMLRISNLAEIGQRELNVEDKPLTFADKTVTLVDVAGNRLEIAGHGLVTGDGPVTVDSSTNDPPAPLDEAEEYWVIVLDPDHVRLASSYVNAGGAQGLAGPATPIVLADAGTGTLLLKDTDDTVRGLQEIEVISRGYLRVTLELRCHSATGTGDEMATSILERVRARRELPTPKQILIDANLGIIDVDRVRAVQGIKDALLFEPRSYLDVHFCIASQEPEAVTRIESVELTDVTVPKTFTVP